jgi:hypothetical protein
MPEPVLISIAAALAGKSVAAVYELVKNKFAQRREAQAALEAAQGASSNSAKVAALATELERAETADPDFSKQLRAAWNERGIQQDLDHGSVSNISIGTVTGSQIQAKDIHGNITFGT